ncbi:MAG: putative membrane protein, partial [Parvibaculaceae bacterium]
MIDDISGMLAYKKRVSRDLITWENEGWVTPTNADHIRKSLEQSDATSRMPMVFTFLGAILLGFAALSFVAANWAEMSKLTKVVLLFTAMGSAYGAAIYFHLKKRPGYANIATLLGL